MGEGTEIVKISSGKRSLLKCLDFPIDSLISFIINIYQNNIVSYTADTTDLVCELYHNILAIWHVFWYTA